MMWSPKLLSQALVLLMLVAACAPAAMAGGKPMIFEAPRDEVYVTVVAAITSLDEELPPAAWMRRPTGWQIARQIPESGYVVAELMYGNLYYIDRYVRLTAHVTPVDAGVTQVVLTGGADANDAAEVVVRALVTRFGPPR